jgi:hypothetical protein
MCLKPDGLFCVSTIGSGLSRGIRGGSSNKSRLQKDYLITGQPILRKIPHTVRTFMYVRERQTMSTPSGSIFHPSQGSSPSHSQNSHADTWQTVLLFAASATHLIAAKFAILTAAIVRQTYSSHHDAKQREKNEAERARVWQENEKKNQDLMAQRSAGIEAIEVGVGRTNETIEAVGAGIDRAVAGIEGVGIGVDRAAVGIEAVEVGVKETRSEIAALVARVDALVVGVQQLGATANRILYVFAGIGIVVALTFVGGVGMLIFWAGWQSVTVVPSHVSSVPAVYAPLTSPSTTAAPTLPSSSFGGSNARER